MFSDADSNTIKIKLIKILDVKQVYHKILKRDQTTGVYVLEDDLMNLWVTAQQEKLSIPVML